MTTFQDSAGSQNITMTTFQDSAGSQNIRITTFQDSAGSAGGVSTEVDVRAGETAQVSIGTEIEIAAEPGRSINAGSLEQDRGTHYSTVQYRTVLYSQRPSLPLSTGHSKIMNLKDDHEKDIEDT